MEFQLAQPNQIRGDQLAAEIKAATSLDMTRRLSFVPPLTVYVGGDLQGKEAQIASIVTAHVPNPQHFQAEKDAALSGNNETTLRGKLDNALTQLQAYRALASPTAAQTTAAVKLLCGITVWLIRLRLGKLDAVD